MRWKIFNRLNLVSFCLNTIPFLFIISSCSQNLDIKKIDGTDWAGVISGNFSSTQYQINHTIKTVTYIDGSNIVASNLVIPNYVMVGDTIMSVQLGEWCFANCQFSITGSVEFNDFIISIPYRCFYMDDQISSIKFHRYPEVFEDECFYGGFLEHIYVNNSVNWALKVKKIGQLAFYDTCLSDPILFGDSLTSLGFQSFYSSHFLHYVDFTFANNLTTLPDECFALCKSLEIVKLGKRINFIGKSAFYQDISLRSIILPSTGMSIELGESCFSQCSNFVGFSKQCHFTNIGEGCFFQDESLDMNIWEPSFGLKVIPKTACESTNISKIKFYVDGPTDVQDRAFATCENLHCLDFSDFVYPNVPKWTGINIFDGAPQKGVVLVDDSNLFNDEFRKLFFDETKQTFKQGIVFGIDYWQVRVKSN